ncbi:protein kinase domain-containing protein [Coxiella burnetii]|uniref:protein kinase domain-containing protein n=1 Tax=Coxiella burnetii TaxID=777 RepID=UPI001F5B6273|nr:protein kinase [Coxiella burnetii]
MEFLKRTEKQTTWVKHRWIVLRVENASAPFFCAIDLTEDYLGHGTFGVVYKAYSIDSNGNIDEKRTWAAKVFRVENANATSQIGKIMKEAEIFGRYYRVDGWQRIESNKNDENLQSDFYLFFEYIPGKSLGELLAKNTLNLTFEERVQLIFYIVQQLHLMHYFTPSTGKPIVHRDLKPLNIQVNIEKKAVTIEDKTTYLTNISSAIFDFGLADESEKDEEIDSLKPTTLKGTSEYLSPEILSEKAGVRSDLYSLVPTIAELLGAPHEKLFKNRKLDPKIGKYDLTDLQIDAAYSKDIGPLIKEFLQKMQDDDYWKRPTTDEVLRFFTTLNKYCAINLCSTKSEEEREERLAPHFAKLIILASGCWNHTPFGFNHAFEHYDFEGDLYLRETVIEPYKIKNKTGSLINPDNVFLPKLLSKETSEIDDFLKTLPFQKLKWINDAFLSPEMEGLVGKFFVDKITFVTDKCNELLSLLENFNKTYKHLAHTSSGNGFVSQRTWKKNFWRFAAFV